MNSENKMFYVTFTAKVENEYHEVKVGKPFKKFDTAVQFGESAMEASKNAFSFEYVNFMVSFH